MMTILQSIQNKIFSILLIAIFSVTCLTTADAQLPLDIQVEVIEPFPTRYQYWVSEGANYIIPVTNKTNEQYNFFLRATIEGVGGNAQGVLLKVKDDFLPASALTIDPYESLILTGQEIGDSYGNDVGTDAFDILGVDIEPNGELPEGEYRVCFEILFYQDAEPSTNYFLGPKSCSESFIATQGDLELITPFSGDVVTHDDMPLYFSWIYNSSYLNAFDLEYRLKIFHLPPNLNESIEEYIIDGAVPYLITDPSSDLFFVYDTDLGYADLVDGGQYAAYVELVSGGSGLFTENGRRSNINTFTYYTDYDGDGSNGDSDNVLQDYVQCEDKCEPPLPENTNPTSSYANISSFEIGMFTVEDVEITTESVGKIFGNGTVQIDFLNNLKLNVLFTGIELNTDGKALDGNVIAIQNPQYEGLLETIAQALVSHAPLSDNMMLSFEQAINNIAAIQDFVNGDAVNIPFGISQSLSGQSFTLAVTDFKLTASSSDIDFVNILNLSGFGNDALIGLGAANICVAPDGFGNEFNLHLLQETTLPLDGGIVLQLTGGQPNSNVTYDNQQNQEPCHFEIDCNGIRSMTLSGKIHFPQDMLVKEAIDGTIIQDENVAAYFSTEYEKVPGDENVYLNDHDGPAGTHFIAEVSMDPFQIKGLDGWGFELTQGSLDLSKIDNADLFDFPEGYAFEEDEFELWQGLFIHELKIKAPKQYTEGQARSETTANNILIDTELTADIFAENLLPYNVGSYKGWGMSIDTFVFKMTQNTVDHGFLRGKFGAPVFDENEYLNYSALIDEKSYEEEDGNYYAFTGLIQPNDDLRIPMAVASASVCASSYLALQLSPVEQERNVEMFLKGALDIRTEDFGADFLGNMTLNLADFQIQYNSVQGFVLPRETDYNGGTYFGFQGVEEASECVDLPEAAVNQIFDRLIAEYEDGEDPFRTIDEEPEQEEVADNESQDSDQLNNTPIRFTRSRFNVVQGVPTLEVIVEMEFSEDEISEAGMTVYANKEEAGSKYRFGIERVEFTYAEGAISMVTPVEGSGLAENEPVLCSWEVDIADQDLVERLRYNLEIIEIPTDAIPATLDSHFTVHADDPFFTALNIEGTDFSIPLTAPDNPFQVDHRYAVRVQAFDPTGQDDLVRDGMSNVNTFIFGQTTQTGPNAGNNGSECAARCSPLLPVNTTPLSAGTAITSFRMGNFTVEDVDIVQGSGGRISGTGKVSVDFLNNVKVNVDILDVLLNSDFEAYEGTITGTDESGSSSLLSNVADYITQPGTNGATVIQSLKSALDVGRMVADIATGSSIGLPFGINADIGGNQVVIAFTDFQLTPTSSDVDFINLMSFPSLGENFSFGLGAMDICIAPDGFGQEMKISLLQDLELFSDGALSFTIKGGQSPLIVPEGTDEPSYLHFDCNGFKAFNIAGDIAFPQNMIVKEDVDGNVDMNTRAKAYFNAKYTVVPGVDVYSGEDQDAGSHLMVSLDMDNFQIAGLEGWSFQVMNAALDLSELENDPEMFFPEGFEFAESPELWKGVYLDTLRVYPPSAFDANGNRAYGAIYNLLIDTQLSGEFVAGEILDFENGNFKGWGMSIDTFSLKIVQNSIVHGKMSGEFGAPIMRPEDYLRYQAGVYANVDDETGNDYYYFNAVATPPAAGYQIGVPMIASASVNICGSSYIGLQISPKEEESHLEVFLKGNMGVDLQALSGNPNGGDFKLAALEYQLKYNTVKGFVLEEDVGNGSGTTFGLGLAVADGCTASFTPDFDQMMTDYISSGGEDDERTIAFGGDDGPSPDDDEPEPILDEENVMNKFPIRLSSFGLSLTNGLPSLSFVVDLALSSGGQGIVAGAGLTLHTQKNDNLDGGKFNFEFSHVQFNCARLAADLDFMLLVACLCHENSGGVDGYFGQVVVDIDNTATIDLKGGFATVGSKDSGQAYGETEEFYGLWYIDAKVSLPTGIVMGPITLNGVGGGIYWNVAPPNLPGQDEVANTEAGEDPPAGLNMVGDCMNDLISRYELEVPASVKADLSQGPPVPHYGKRAIRLNASLSIIKPELVIIDPLVGVEWTDGEGIDQIDVGGYLYVLQDSYNGRGAPPGNAPNTSNPGEGADLENSMSNPSEGIGSRLWMSSFNTLYINRTTVNDQPKTLVAYEGIGTVYLNVIPDMLYGTASEDDPYRFIRKDIFVGSVNHPTTISRGYATAGDGNTYWHAYFGNPYRDDIGVGAVSFDLMGIVSGNSTAESMNAEGGIEATNYFMVGHGIPSTLPPVPEVIQNIIGRSEGADDENNGSFDGPAIDDKSQRQGSTTSGMAFGGGVNIQLGFEKVIYADLNVNIGMDMLLINSQGMSCAANGKIYDPPGLAGFYGMGQAYAGLEGALGVRGKILGKKIDIKFLELGAAMMIQVGGPEPFWIDGKAGVYYSVLGGRIEGNAYVEVTAGDKCYPYDSGLFSLDAIDQIYPGPSMTGAEAASPYVNPTVTFKVKVADKDRPWESEMDLPIVLPNNATATVKIAAVLDDFRFEATGNNDLNRTGNYEFSDNKKKLTFTPNLLLADTDDPAERNRRWEMYVKVRAKQRKSNGSWEYISNSTDDSTVVFATKPLDPYIKHVAHTNPIRGQRYFMSDEWNNGIAYTGGNIGSISIDDKPGDDSSGSNKSSGGKGSGGKSSTDSVTTQNDDSNKGSVQINLGKPGIIRFHAREKPHRFYSEDINGTPCSYEVIFKDPYTNTEVYRYILTPGDIKNKYVQFPMPVLESNTSYVMQLVRKKESLFIPLMLGTITLEGSTIAPDVQEMYDVSNDYTITYESEQIDPFQSTAHNETLLHMVAFSTSKFRTLEEKLEGVSAEFIPGQTDCGLWCTNYDNMRIVGLDEPFEKIEILGYTEKVRIPGQEVIKYITEPRVKILDPLDGQYFEEDVKPVVNAYLDKMRSIIDDVDVGLRMQVPDDIGDDIINDNIMQSIDMDGIGNGNGGFGGFDRGPNGIDIHNLNPIDAFVYKLDFLEESYSLINYFNYNSFREEIFAERSFHIDEVLDESSYLVSPMDQEGIHLTQMEGGNMLTFFNSANIIHVGEKDVMFRYETREKVEQQVSSMANYGENCIQEIKYPTGALYQSWSTIEVNQHINPFITAFNDLVTSSIYTGNSSTIDLGSTSNTNVYYATGSLNGGSDDNMVTATNIWLPYIKSSYIDAVYNIESVDGRDNQGATGSSKRFILDD